MPPMNSFSSNLDFVQGDYKELIVKKDVPRGGIKSEILLTEPTLRKSPKTPATEEAEIDDYEEILKTLKSLCIKESPWKTYHKVCIV